MLTDVGKCFVSIRYKLRLYKTNPEEWYTGYAGCSHKLGYLDNLYMQDTNAHTADNNNLCSNDMRMIHSSVYCSFVTGKSSY